MQKEYMDNRELMNDGKTTEDPEIQLEELRALCREKDRIISEKDKQIEDLQEQYDQKSYMLENLIEMNPYSMTIINTSGKGYIKNRANRELFGKDTTNKNYNFWKDPNLIESGYIDMLSKMIRDNKPVKFHPMWYNAGRMGEEYDNKKVCVAGCAFPMKNREGIVDQIVVMHEDITARALAEQELQAAHDELKLMNIQLEEKVKERTLELAEANDELENKNRELEDFAFRVSHKLKNSILVLKRIIECRMDNLEDLKKYIVFFVEESDNLMEFVENLLQLARAGKVINNKEETDLNALIGGIFHLRQPSGIKTELIIRNPIPAIRADMRSLEQVFVNFFLNSIEHHDPEKEKLLIEIDCKEDKGNVIIYYRDNGEGIPEENLDRVFEVSYSSKGRKKYGFGMTINQKIIEAHGGSISVRSEGIKKGVEFAITLPLE